MPLHFVLGPSGAGKSEYIYKKIIQDSMNNPRTNYILLVPEQQSLAIQRKLVTMHPRHGFFNIDCIGFNRLTYRIFDELGMKPTRVLEDFGKSMLLRQAAVEKKDELLVYGSSLDKAGFIDEAKSLMSEIYQYDVPREALYQVVEKLKQQGQETLLAEKLRDMITIFRAFDEKKSDAYIVAEQMMELLAEAVSKSALIQRSVIILDGFTGFTPIQLKVIERLMESSKSMTVLLTMDEKAFAKKKVPEHDLFALSKETMNQLLRVAEETRTRVESEVFLGEDGGVRWNREHPLFHLERNLFRYPYKTYTDENQQVQIWNYDNPREELAGVARQIRRMVMEEGYRYKDIAIVSGDLEKTSGYVEQMFSDYDVPYFLDYARPLKNNPCVDALEHVLRVVEENFSYDSVFAFLKSGVVRELEFSEIEELENVVLATGKRGIRSWSQIWKGDVDEIRQAVMEILNPIYKALSGGPKMVSLYVKLLYELMERLSYEEQLEDREGLYEKICGLLQKMEEIMPDEKVGISDFCELFQVGLKDISLGHVPAAIDTVIVGDITRTRLDDIRALFIVGVNDGVIPKRQKRAQIINDKERAYLQELSIHLAPTEQTNAYIEQFYLYMNMTKPKEKLILSYVNMSATNEPMRPSYILERVRHLFPDMRVRYGQKLPEMVATRESSVKTLVQGIKQLMAGDNTYQRETLSLYRLYLDEGQEEKLEELEQAMLYHNVPGQLREEIVKLIRLQDMAMSVSKLEQYARCAYGFYLRYVLGLKERKIRSIDKRDVGNILHRAMEGIFSYVRDHGGWTQVSEEARDALAERFIKQEFAVEYQDEEVEDGQYAFLEKTLIRIGKRTLQKLHSMMDDDFIPTYFEQSFSRKLSYGKKGESFNLRGIVDRGDIRIDRENHKISLRVIDYKSGNHTFDLGKLYEGVELQISIYMEVMKDFVDGIHNSGKQPGDEAYYDIVPDGMYYYHMQDPYVLAQSEEKAEEERQKKLKFVGVDASDSTMFHTVTEFAKYKAGELATAIAQGKIEKNPEKDGERSACDFCPFKATCRFDEKHGGNRYHYTGHSTKEYPKLLEEMTKKIGGDKNEVDR